MARVRRSCLLLVVLALMGAACRVPAARAGASQKPGWERGSGLEAERRAAHSAPEARAPSRPLSERPAKPGWGLALR